MVLGRWPARPHPASRHLHRYGLDRSAERLDTRPVPPRHAGEFYRYPKRRDIFWSNVEATDILGIGICAVILGCVAYSCTDDENNPAVAGVLAAIFGGPIAWLLVSDIHTWF